MRSTTRKPRAKASLFLSVFVSLVLAVALTACGGGSSSGGGTAASTAESPMAKAAGTYTGIWQKFVGDPDDARVNEPTVLTLNADGTGTHARDEMEFSVTWELDGENFTMEETFIGDPIVYTGTLIGDDLDIFNGDPEDDFTYEYVYKRGNPEDFVDDPMADFSLSYTEEQTTAMSTAMAWGWFGMDEGHVYGAFWGDTGARSLASREFTDNDGNISSANNTVLDEGCTPNYISVTDDYIYYLRVSSGTYTVNRVAKAGGEPEVLYGEGGDYLTLLGERLYFTDANGHFVSTALDGSDMKTLIEKEVAYPYPLDERWVVYSDGTDGDALHLFFVPTGFDLRISENAAYASVLDGTTLWFAGDDGSGTTVLHKMDLSAYDESTQSFPEEVGENEIGEIVLVDANEIHLVEYADGETGSVSKDAWETLERQPFDYGDGYGSTCFVSPDYLITQSTDAANTASIWCYRQGSVAGFLI